jgi:uncharacterized protein YukE
MSDAVSVVRRVDVLAETAAAQVARIQRVNVNMRMLSLNARLQASKAGSAGRTFVVVADQMQELTEQVGTLVEDLHREVVQGATQVAEAGRRLTSEAQGRRLQDLAHNLINIMDRNLYERSCDVRWWATDAAVVAACTDPSQAALATDRLAVILRAYTVYADIWIIAPDGRILSNGRPVEHPGVATTSVADEVWFREAMATADGDAYAMGDIAVLEVLGGRQVAIYATAVREGGRTDGAPIGVLAVLFDWQTQSHAVVEGLRIDAQERGRTRALLVDRHLRIIAASDGRGILSDHLVLPVQQAASGYIEDEHGTTGYALTPGFETYQGRGWYGVVWQGHP